MVRSDELLRLVLTQVWQVATIAVVVWVLTRAVFKNQSQMSHLLWGLVLIKVITPPVWSSPTSVFSWIGQSTIRSSFTMEAREPKEFQQVPITSNWTIDLQWKRQLDAVGSVSSDSEKSSLRPADANSVTVPQAGLKQVTRSFLAIWLGGVGILLAASAFRIVYFWRWVRGRASGQCDNDCHQHRFQLTEQLQASTLAMTAELGIRRRVRVRLIDAPIGPAVVGLFRPTIILPQRIVEDRSIKFLEPLLGHELMHIRRGDLFWALLQSLSISLLWFHPLVWLASRRLTVESERCCDEQTIAWLGCSPAAYARSLIDVLERKHQLRVAPVLPGVRPVDITRKRLEMIMRMGQGCRKQTPIWAWGLFVTAVALVLPGAAFIGAQEVADFSRPADRIAESPQPTPADLNLGSAANHLVESQVEVGDLLEQLKSLGSTEEQARNIIISLLPQRLRQPIFRGNPDGKTSQSENARIEGNCLRIVGTSEQIANARDAIAQRRELGFRQAVLQVRFITISKARMDQLNVPWRKAPAVPDDQFDTSQFREEALVASHSTVTREIGLPAKKPRQDEFILEKGRKVSQAGYRFSPSPGREPPTRTTTVSFDAPSATELQVPATLMPAFCAVIDNGVLLRVLDTINSDVRTNILQAPRVTAFNGTTVHINDTVQRAFVTDVIPLSGEAGTNMLPTIKTAVEGIKSLAQPNVGADGTIELLFALNERWLQQVETFTYDRSVGSDPYGNPTASGTTVQIPQLVSRYLVLKSNMKVGDSLLVTSGVPTLAASSAGGDEVLLALVTASDVTAIGEQTK